MELTQAHLASCVLHTIMLFVMKLEGIEGGVGGEKGEENGGPRCSLIHKGGLRGQQVDGHRVDEVVVNVEPLQVGAVGNEIVGHEFQPVVVEVSG